MTGEITPPCAVAVASLRTWPSSITRCAASRQPAVGLLAATGTGLTRAGDDKLTNTIKDTMAYVTVSPPVLLGARENLNELPLAGERGGEPFEHRVDGVGKLAQFIAAGPAGRSPLAQTIGRSHGIRQSGCETPGRPVACRPGR